MNFKNFLRVRNHLVFLDNKKLNEKRNTYLKYTLYNVKNANGIEKWYIISYFIRGQENAGGDLKGGREKERIRHSRKAHYQSEDENSFHLCHRRYHRGWRKWLKRLSICLLSISCIDVLRSAKSITGKKKCRNAIYRKITITMCDKT